MLQDDIEYVKKLLPPHYNVTAGRHKHSIHCTSPIGVRKEGTDAEDEEHWYYIIQALKNHFSRRFQEVFHNTSFCHTDFTIYLRAGVPEEQW